MISNNLLNAPVIWIIIPGIAAFLLFLFRRFSKVTNIIGFVLVVLLSIFALVLTINQPFSISFIEAAPSITIQDTLRLLGRSFVIDDSNRAAILLIYTSITFWFGGELILRSNNSFIPVGLGITALLAAAISVVPFLYAALFIVIAALASVLILAPPGNLPGKGVLRFVTFQTLGVPFILIAGWLLTGVDVGLTDQALILRVTALLGLGFAIFLAVIPFHSWIPQLTEDAHPYSVAFIIYIFPQAISLFLLYFISRYQWVSLVPTVFSTIRLMGVLMVLIGGVWAAFQNHLGRMMGFAALMEIGFTLLAIGLIEQDTLSGISISISQAAPFRGIFYALFLPRLVGLALWALALVSIKENFKSLSLNDLKGAASVLPFASISVIIAMFSLAGIPLLAGFPLRIVIWSNLLNNSTTYLILVFIGSTGLVIAGLRTISSLFKKSDPSLQYSERMSHRILLTAAWIFLLIFGLFPQLFLAEILTITGIISAVM